MSVTLLGELQFSWLQNTFGRAVPISWTRYFENEWTDFGAHWYEWYTEQWEETI